MEHLPPGTSGRETTATGNGEHTNGNGGERATRRLLLKTMYIEALTGV